MSKNEENLYPNVYFFHFDGSNVSCFVFLRLISKFLYSYIFLKVVHYDGCYQGFT